MAKKPQTKAGAKPAPAPKKPQKTAVTKPGKPAAKPVKKTDKRGTPKGKGVVRGKGGGGRIGNPKFEPTAEQRKLVETHAACGTPHWLIALEVQISETVLYKYFRFELDAGLLRINARISSLVAKQALSGCKSSQSLWLKSRGGWADRMLLSTPAGEPIQLAAVPRNPDLQGLSVDELKTWRKLTAKLEGVPDAPDA